MIITVHPSDLIKRCLWAEYKKFCLSNITEEEINDIIIKDEPFVISENDSYVIGLLKVVETTNLIHRLKNHIEGLLNVKSNLFDNKLFINRNVIISEIKNFKNRFPDSFKPSFEYKKSIDELNSFIDEILIKVDDVKIHKKILNDKSYTFLLSSDIKSLINS